MKQINYNGQPDLNNYYEQIPGLGNRCNYPEHTKHFLDLYNYNYQGKQHKTNTNMDFNQTFIKVVNKKYSVATLKYLILCGILAAIFYIVPIIGSVLLLLGIYLTKIIKK
jgi:hypothetical protein